MSHKAVTPLRLGRWRSLPFLAGLFSDPLAMTRRLHNAYGPFVLLHYPFSRRSRPRILGCIADAGLYQAMFSAPDIWRTVNIHFPGLRNHASHRLTIGMMRLRGARHAHYRRLLLPPLKRPAVAAMSPEMASIADAEVASWPRGVPTDLQPLIGRLAQHLAIDLLFGDDRERAMPIAAMIALQERASRPFPGREYPAWLKVAAKQERAILEWAGQKRGDPDPKDILSIIVNNPDETGAPPGPEIIGGILSFTFGATFETCQNGLAWTLILVAQHPQLAGMLADEIKQALGGDLPTMDRIGGLPLLDAVIKEGMRLFPPVPLQVRKSMTATTLGDADVEPGTRVLASAHLINRNPDIYGEPDRFLPERWYNLDPSPYDYTVFGAGGRMCPGFLFASQMLKIGLAAILSRYRIDMLRDARIDYRTRVSLAPYPGVPAVLRDIADAPIATRITGTIHKLVHLPHAA